MTFRILLLLFASIYSNIAFVGGSIMDHNRSSRYDSILNIENIHGKLLSL